MIVVHAFVCIGSALSSRTRHVNGSGCGIGSRAIMGTMVVFVTAAFDVVSVVQCIIGYLFLKQITVRRRFIRALRKLCRWRESYCHLKKRTTLAI